VPSLPKEIFICPIFVIVLVYNFNIITIVVFHLRNKSNNIITDTHPDSLIDFGAI